MTSLTGSLATSSHATTDTRTSLFLQTQSSPGFSGASPLEKRAPLENDSDETAGSYCGDEKKRAWEEREIFGTQKIFMWEKSRDLESLLTVLGDVTQRNRTENRNQRL